MNDWCGEHSVIQEVEPAVVSSSEYDIVTDTVIEPKKRGRKPKNDQTFA